jgi:hypothetical protein
LNAGPKNTRIPLFICFLFSQKANTAPGPGSEQAEKDLTGMKYKAGTKLSYQLSAY